MGKRKEIDIEYKLSLVKECVAGRMRGREAARRVGVSETSMRRWISRYQAEGAAAFQRTKGKGKYEEAVKAAAVEDYLAGRGSLFSIAGKYKISSPALILDWVRVYHRQRTSDAEAGGDVMARTKYTVEDRVQVIKEHLEDRKTISEVAEEHDMGYHLVYDWVKKYQAKGLPGLEDRRGQRIAAQEPRTMEEELRIRIAQLEHENHLLRLERDL